MSRALMSHYRRTVMAFVRAYGRCITSIVGEREREREVKAKATDECLLHFAGVKGLGTPQASRIEDVSIFPVARPTLRGHCRVLGWRLLWILR